MYSRYYIAKNHRDVKKLVKACLSTGYCCYDFETNAQPIYNDIFTPTLLSITFQAGSGIAIPLDHFETKEYCDNGYNWKKELKYIGRKLIENKDLKLTKVGWNIKFDNQIWLKYNIIPAGRMLDGMLAKYILNEEKPNGLKEMVTRYLPEFSGYQNENNLDKLPWDKKHLEPLSKYGCLDTDCTFRLMLFFEKKLIDTGLYSLYRNLIMPASLVLTEAEKNGLYLDRTFNEKLLHEYKTNLESAKNKCLDIPKVKKYTRKLIESRVNNYIESIEKELEELDYNNPKDKRKIDSRENKISNIKAGIFTTKKELQLIEPLNLGSPTQLKSLLFSDEGFGFPINKYTDKGEPSTDEDTLKELRLTVKKPDSPKAIFLDNLLDYRGVQKMYTTFIEGWHDKVQDDDCLHGQYKIIGCVSGNTKLVCKDKDIVIKDICPKSIGIKDITKEDIWVLSHEGTWEQITHTINKGKQPMYEVITKDNNRICCTKEHKFLTIKGMKTLKYILKNDIPLIMHDVTRLNIEKPKVGRNSKEVIFKDIPGFIGYLASNEGKIYSVRTKGSGGYLDYNHPHEMIPRLNNGRYRVGIRNGKPKKSMYQVSHLVWMAFNNSIIPENMVIDHIDCNPLNNIPENLQCISSSQNVKRAYKNTRKAFTNGSINGMTVTNTLNVGKILYEYSNGCTQSQLVERYGISQKQVSRIINKQAWKYIYLTKIKSCNYLGEKIVYDLSVNDKHSYVTRSNFISSNTTSGRLSSSEPNMQQIPKTSVDPNIKKQLISPPGTLYMALDYSQAELRIMAHLSGDETYLTAFREGKDPHLAIAAKKYGVSYEEALEIMESDDHPDKKIWKVRRKQAKQVAFGIIYGIQARLLAVKLSDPKEGIIVTPGEAQKELDEFFILHPKIKKFMKKQEKFLIKHGFVQSLFGRKRRLPQVYSDDGSEAAYAVRLAVNMPCQSAASDMTLFASILNYWDMRQGKFPFLKEVCTVHDAVYYNPIPEDINVWTVHKIWDTCRNPKTKEYFGFEINDVDMSMDFTIGRSMAEELPFIPGYDYRKMLEKDFSVDEYMQEHKKFKGIEIKDFPNLFKEEYELAQKRFINRRIA